MPITVSEKEGVVIFRLVGKMIAPGVREISETVSKKLAHLATPPRLVFDFKGVTGMDSSGLGVLMKVYSDIHPRGGEIGVINVDKHVKNLIVMARLITVFKNFDSEDDAVAALLRRA